MARVKSVLLVDFDNIFAATGIAMVDTLPKWLLWLSDGALSDRGKRRKFLTKRVYWNSQYDTHREAFEAAGFEAFNCRAHAKTKIASGKSSADIVMTMDAIELRQSVDGLDEIILLTTDSDFVPVVNRLQLARLRVVTAGKETDPTYGLYSEHADGVIHIGALKAAFDYERAPRKWYRLRSDPPVIAPLRQQAERTLRALVLEAVRLAVLHQLQQRRNLLIRQLLGEARLTKLGIKFGKTDGDVSGLRTELRGLTKDLGVAADPLQDAFEAMVGGGPGDAGGVGVGGLGGAPAAFDQLCVVVLVLASAH